MHGKAWLIGAACLAAACSSPSARGGRGGNSGGGAAGKAGAAGTSGAATGGGGGVATRNGGGGGNGGADTQNGGQGGHGGPLAGSSGQGGGASTGGQAGTGSGSGGRGGAGGQGTARRIAWPCTAALPTGFCMESEAGEFIGGGKSYGASGAGSVTLREVLSRTSISVVLSQPTPNAGPWDLGVTVPMGAVLMPDLYPVRGASPPDPTSAFLSVSGEGRTCGTVTGRFSIEELTRGPGVGVTRVSLTFELHCGAAVPALRGVVNYAATGRSDPTPVPDRVIPLSGKVFRVAYDPAAHVAYGLDATNARIAKIDLATGTASYVAVTHVPNDACVDPVRGRLFVVNKGSQTITEYATNGLSAVRDIPWMSIDRAPTQTQFRIYCTRDRLFAVDAASIPALFTVEGLDSATPVVTDRSAQLSAVNGLAVNAAGSELYAWYQRYQNPLGVYVSRSRVSDLVQLDVSPMTVPNFGSSPADAPLLLDESRGYVFVKDKIFDASHLATVSYTLPGTYSVFTGPEEVAYALDASTGFFATKNFVYELSRFDPVAATVVPSSDQLFFDKAGELWMLSTARATLSGQLVHR